MNRLLRPLAFVTAGALTVYGMILGDIWLRAREAYREGEKYSRWHERPDEKIKFLEEQFAKQKKEIGRLAAKKRMSEAEYEERLELLEFDKNQALAESSAKYAYIWYQTAVELFSPPESVWVKKSREKMPAMKELWKQELRAKKIPFEDYMLE